MIGFQHPCSNKCPLSRIRATHWVPFFVSKNANLILTCGFLELVNVLHSCKDTKIATQHDFCRGMSQSVNWYLYKDMINVSRPCELVFVLDLSFFSVTVGLAILCSQHWILVILSACTVAFIKIWGRLVLFILYLHPCKIGTGISPGSRQDSWRSPGSRQDPVEVARFPGGILPGKNFRHVSRQESRREISTRRGPAKEKTLLQDPGENPGGKQNLDSIRGEN